MRSIAQKLAKVEQHGEGFRPVEMAVLYVYHRQGGQAGRQQPHTLAVHPAAHQE